LGIGVTAAYAFNDGLMLRVPPIAIGGGLLAACLLGALAGLYPAQRAAGVAPTEALRSV
jgi:putative ABC transport system permease protein